MKKIEIDNPIQIERITTSPQNQRGQQISISEHQKSDTPKSRAAVILEQIRENIKHPKNQAWMEKIAA